MVLLARLLVVGLTGCCFAFALGENEDPPVRSDLREEVQVRLIQLEITATPRDDASCRDLQAEDLELVVAGKEREIVALDLLGDYGALVGAYPEDKAVGEQLRPAGQFVFYFDEWHIRDLCCGDLPRHRARSILFEWARDFVRDHLQPRDRVMLVTFTGWPTIKTGWMEDPDEIVAALDALEVDPAVVTANIEHANDDAWWDGLRSLASSLGRYDGSKHLLRMADCDPKGGWPSSELSKLSGRLLAERVTIHGVNAFLHEPCVDPSGLSTLALNSGGFKFMQPNHAAKDLEAILRCRYLVSFYPKKKDASRARQFRVRSRNGRYRIATLMNYETIEGRPTEEQERDALFLLPHWSDGLRLEAGLWPLRPSGKRGAWRSLALVRVYLEEDEPGLEETDEITVDVIVRERSRLAGEFRKVISGSQLSAMRIEGRAKALAFPLELKPGNCELVVVASSGDSKTAASLHTNTAIPEPPDPGQAGPWMRIDRVTRIGGQVTPTPALDGQLSAGEQPMFLGYACPSGPRASEAYLASVKKSAESSVVVPVSFHWLDQARDSTACGWLLGTPLGSLDQGIWEFLPPENLFTAGPGQTVRFRIAAPRELVDR